MKCPVCERELAPTLSICPSCGAMMFDSVREELQVKITSGRLRPKPEVAPRSMDHSPAVAVAVSPPVVSQTSCDVRLPAPAVGAARAALAPATVGESSRRVQTADLRPARTDPTLMGFQGKNPIVPEWRLQLQNAVQQRKGIQASVAGGTGDKQVRSGFPKGPVPARPFAIPAIEPEVSDLRVANALRRIAESRAAFSEVKRLPTPTPAAAKSHKFDVVVGNSVKVSAPPAVVKPRLISEPISLKRDTNKLPPIEAMIGEGDQQTLGSKNPKRPAREQEAVPDSSEFAVVKRIRISAENVEEAETKYRNQDLADIEDLASVSMRFGAGLFDLIITSFASLLLLSPIAFSRGEWLTTAGVLTYVGVCAVITFIYMTICLGFYGKTMGMRLFSLELVDALENEYPTLHQAAVNSSVFLLSLVLGGAGFVTMFFNEEKRAAHDLLSGTILVREF